MPGKRATRAQASSAGVVTAAGMQEGDGGNAARNKGDFRRFGLWAAGSAKVIPPLFTLRQI